MKIQVNEIPPKGLEVEEVKTAGELDIERPDIEFLDKITIFARLEREFDSVKIRLKIKSRIEFSCARCLEDEEQMFEREFEVIRDVKEDRNIDLTELAREEIIFSYPAKLLCDDDCKGLCPQCGRNKNVHTCRCEKQNDSRGINIDGIDDN